MTTNKDYHTSNHHINCSVFGGEITIEDFNTYFPNKKRINNQANALHFEEIIELKHKEEKKYKNMTLEELRKMKIISNTDGRPVSYLTDEKWQKEFNIRKMFITPHPKGIKRLGGKIREFGLLNEGKNEKYRKYNGQTNWQEYCAFINDILKNIRSGQIDYCYYIYQIIDLTKFHYNTLKTKYCDGYWEVWLETK